MWRRLQSTKLMASRLPPSLMDYNAGALKRDWAIALWTCQSSGRRSTPTITGPSIRCLATCRQYSEHSLLQFQHISWPSFQHPVVEVSHWHLKRPTTQPKKANSHFRDVALCRSLEYFMLWYCDLLGEEHCLTSPCKILSVPCR